ncbi:MAG TPA: 4a-hydroxytetrahydrobiopterin dehydratase [Aquabacterium sp.]|uniref:4a-hydroxytetrahydrobiopterin dehydratase n=1 Tax=Aquabacterium sp. TaxID=1872578 RepID=UPI002E34DB1C|nr:4a-hydroxytetrahydrobiopterin dehydratase [Aquabacterium sp.]HEX5354593.1 4a-hydroxytetrahydrobiopterin dehydratase [Aquabacterium sp.]
MPAHPALPLHEQHSSHQKGPALSPDEQQLLLSQLRGWQVDANVPGGVLSKTFKLADFHRTMAFVNAVAWIAHEQDHHPDLAVSYNTCTIRWSTHSVGGLSINDFICAARVDALSA